MSITHFKFVQYSILEFYAVHPYSTYILVCTGWVKQLYTHTLPVIEYLAYKLHTCIQEHCRYVLIQFLYAVMSGML